MAIFTGTGGNDTLTGTSGADELYGLGGDDTLSGGNGNDLLDGGTGADTMTGGFGNDTYEVDDVGDVVVETSTTGGTDTVRTALASYTLTTNVENLVLLANAAARSITGNSGANHITMASGAVSVNGGNGSDTVSYVAETGAVTVDLVSGVNGGMAADDTLTSIENLTGSAYGDTLSGTAAANVLDGGAGADTLTGRGGNDVYLVDDSGDVVVEVGGEGTDEIRLANFSSYTLPSEVENLRQTTTGALTATGNVLNNEITGNSGSDTFDGGDGHDFLSGQGGDDTLDGGDGHDTLNGGTGADTMDGSTGNDVYVVDNGGDVVVELVGEGTDQVLTTLTSYTLGAHVENLNFTGSGNFQGTGNALANIVYSVGGADTLDGGDGDDELRSQAGDDAVLGGDGDDLLVGGSGVDVLTGGAGADEFRFGGYESGTGTAADRIADFASGSDVIDLSQIDADFATSGNQAFTFIGSAAFSNVAGELRYAFDGVDTWLQGDTNGDGVADLEIVLSGAVTPLVSDFVL